jgi:ankyrin repeat protein
MRLSDYILVGNGIGFQKALQEMPVSDDELGACLCMAAARDDLRSMKYLLDRHVDIHTTLSNSWFPLHYAVSGGAAAAVIYLLTRGANINQRAHDGGTVLHTAIDSAILYANYIQDWAHVNHPPSTQMLVLLLSYAPDVNAQDELGHTPLDDAIQANFYAAIPLLKAHGGKEGVVLG